MGRGDQGGERWISEGNPPRASFAASARVAKGDDGGDGHGGGSDGGDGDGGGSDDGGDWYTEEAAGAEALAAAESELQRRRAELDARRHEAHTNRPDLDSYEVARAAHAVQQAERAVAREQQAKRERKALFDALKPGTPEELFKRIVQQDGQHPPSKKSDEERAAAGGTHMTAQASLVGGVTTAGRPLEGEKEERGSTRGGSAPSAEALAAAGWARKSIPAAAARTTFTLSDR